MKQRLILLAAAAGAAGLALGWAPLPAQKPADPSPAPQQVVRSPAPLPGKDISVPRKEGSVRFAVIGDSGSGEKGQLELARILTDAHTIFPFTFVIMMGDNIYGSDTPRELQKKFEMPYADLLKAGVKFYASLGNHDNPNQRFYKNFNMGGQRYYTFKPADGVRLFALDTNYMGKEQLTWLEKELAASGSDWKLAFFHHPLYSSGGKHGSDVELRQLLEPVFVKHGVDVVFAGHEHFYERLHPQRGILYFISGAAGKLRRGDLQRNSPLTAKGFDTDYNFMLVEIAGDQLYFQTVTASRQIVDAGVVERPRQPDKAAQQQSRPSSSQ